MKKISHVLLSLMIIMACPVAAQENNVEMPEKQKVKMFDHLDVGVSVGTIGINVDAEMPICDKVNVRAGVSFMPNIVVPLHFTVQNYNNGLLGNDKFQEAKETLKEFTGFEVNDYVTMNCKPVMITANVLCDVYPFKKKHWRFTAGFYVGPRRVAKCINKMSDMPSLVSIGIYNGLHDYILETDFIETPIHGDYYLDPDVADKLKAKFGEMGHMGAHAGDFNSDDSPYMMQPDKDGTISAKAFVNAFRPYLGFGYSGDIDKAKRMKLSFDCGAMFWGGSPDVINHEGVNLSREVHDIPGDAGRYIRAIKKFHVYPILNLRFSYNIF